MTEESVPGEEETFTPEEVVSCACNDSYDCCDCGTCACYGTYGESDSWYDGEDGELPPDPADSESLTD